MNSYVVREIYFIHSLNILFAILTIITFVVYLTAMYTIIFDNLNNDICNNVLS